MDIKKYKEIIKYVCSKAGNTGDKTLNRTKLAKIIWLSDLQYFIDTGKSLTGDKILKMPYGPVPAMFLDLTTELVEKREINCREENLGGLPTYIYSSDKSAAKSKIKLEDAEIKNIDTVFDRFIKYTATALSEFSHNQFDAWKKTPTGEEIPLISFLINDAAVNSDDLSWAKSKISQ